MLELATLGLLKREPLHGYRLTQILELFMGCCISVNYGAIYPLLRRLEERSLITSLPTPSIGSGSSRIVYHITAQGEQRWHKCMLECPTESWVNSRSRFMIKVFFLQALEPSHRRQLIEHRLSECRLRLKMIQEEQATYGTLDGYQASTFERGIEMLHSEMNWVQQLLQQEPFSLDSATQT